MITRAVAILAVLTCTYGVAWGQSASPAAKPILSGPLAKLDIKDARLEAGRGAPKGTLKIGLHFGPASYICEPRIEALWAKHEASIDVAERDRLSKELQRAIVEGYYLVPLYLNPFVHAVTQKVLPEGEAVHRYWDTVNAPFPWPWEVWEVKG
jgi:hypothetical protein